MKLFLRPLENPNDPVWSVIISIIILLFGVGYYIRYIMRMSFDELNDARTNQPEGRGSGSDDSTSDTQN
jgi:NADH:ubiquinone oxidoreductase subunit 2 (subunit N)